MIPNEQPSRFGHRPEAQSAKPVHENTLVLEQIYVERKAFVFALKENPRGRFLRVTEDSGKHIANLIIPASGLQDFKKVVDEMILASDKMP
jgi:hypothetical protein